MCELRSAASARLGAIVTICALLRTGDAGARSCGAGPYVSLGDSYTSAPLVPVPTGNPIGCGRSTNNYPSDVARVIKPSSFTDVSCGSATTVEHDTAAVGSVRRHQPAAVQRTVDRRHAGHRRDRRQRRGPDRGRRGMRRSSTSFVRRERLQEPLRRGRRRPERRRGQGDRTEGRDRAAGHPRSLRHTLAW